MSGLDVNWRYAGWRRAVRSKSAAGWRGVGSRRVGVTLLEVLFAIGVMVVGLFGVIALLPIAGARTQRGLEADRAAVVGRNAFREFDLRGMRRPDMWVDATGPGAFVPAPLESFCIDPRFLAVHGGGVAAAQLFPYVHGTHAAGIQRMRRITLWNGIPSLTLAPPFGGPPASFPPLGIPAADAIFVCRDDLVFSLPKDTSLDAAQAFGSGAVQREYEGVYSWLATVVPKMAGASSPGLDRQWGVAGVDDDGNGLTDDPAEQGFPGSDDIVGSSDYILSIVVFARRDSAMPIDGLTERAVEVVDFHTAGFAGGDVVLQAANKEVLELSRDNWLMLSAPSAAGTVFRWYRVLDTDFAPEEVSSGVWQREATLQGPDWDRPEWAPVGTIPSHATLVTGVIAVFEKTIRFERDSVWNPF